MLITPRTYIASQTPDHANSRVEGASRFYTLAGWHQSPVDTGQAADMLFIHQVGSVRVGEVARSVPEHLEAHILTALAPGSSVDRYTLTYTPAADPILPIPSELHVRVKNSSAIPLRAAYLHGPYTLYAACYPSKFDPNTGGSWNAVIKMPTRFGDSHNLAVGQLGPDGDRSMTWVIEIVSQVIFSNSAAVHFELLVGRDAKSVELFSSGAASMKIGPPGKFHEHWLPGSKGQQVTASTGVYSKSITLRVDDTTSLWNTPPLPSGTPVPANDTPDGNRSEIQVNEHPGSECASETQAFKASRQKIHLVVITHGLHSNLGADMLYLKESIDAAARKSSEQARAAKGDHDNTDDELDEQVIVRGFSGNAVRTERGIQYLGKRLAKYVLLMTYPDQPYFPLKGSKSKSFSRPFSARKDQAEPSLETHASVNRGDFLNGENMAYQITSISFIGHSLGGLIQTYAIAYIRKHSPEFFDRIRPVNFIALASPFLGLSNENPMYVRFALDLGLVGRTGQDLGLSWTAPRVRSGWSALIGGRGDSSKAQSQSDPGAKPLLRILPCGPAHEVLHKFQHRTIYSNVVNDGIVPLRTSCLLFLDWRGLDRVEKARRDNGLVGTMAEWGWAELTGANSKSPRMTTALRNGSNGTKKSYQGLYDEAQSSQGVVAVDDPSSPSHSQFLTRMPSRGSRAVDTGPKESESDRNSGPLNSFLALFRPKETKQTLGKGSKIYRRSQTVASFDPNESPAPIVRGNSMFEEDGVHTPPKTTFFESAGDLLMPPLPPTDFILDPAARPRTIFHDRIYHPEDIPHPLPVKRRTLAFGSLQTKNSKPAPASATHLSSTFEPDANDHGSGLKVEEKIARAYHRDLSWRKVLVRLEPDAHNNIIVRRMFTNAYGWPVVKHLVDTHFGHSPTVQVDDTLKQNVDRAKSPNVGPTSSGDEVEGQSDVGDRSAANSHCTMSVPSQDPDTFPADNESHETASSLERSQYTGVSRQDSARWTDRQVDEDDDCESGLDEEDEVGFRRSPRLNA
ncbi:uncharacterized protein N7477_006489 [Penicillium maclennaniae]|uniref:uncharacterized protein n=1 Tax=Penicillium maclennaniae TaxID=1343394 RepID=UPI002541C148|nr:uncharacterized protein N7477_006489 [Penicillium maclennaniae]KAJ5667919.1 hypothetical protein N7477_006489 [Penicillium maclennaniae]